MKIYKVFLLVSLFFYINTAYSAGCTNELTEKSEANDVIKALHCLENRLITIQSGSFNVGHTETDWILKNETSPSGDVINTRSITKFIEYPPNIFHDVPIVHVGISHIDATPGGNSITNNIRVSVKVEKPNKSGFTVRISTWDASKVWGLGINWLAYTSPKSIRPEPSSQQE